MLQGTLGGLPYSNFLRSWRSKPWPGLGVPRPGVCHQKGCKFTKWFRLVKKDTQRFLLVSTNEKQTAIREMQKDQGLIQKELLSQLKNMIWIFGLLRLKDWWFFFTIAYLVRQILGINAPKLETRLWFAPSAHSFFSRGSILVTELWLNRMTHATQVQHNSSKSKNLLMMSVMFCFCLTCQSWKPDSGAPFGAFLLFKRIIYFLFLFSTQPNATWPQAMKPPTKTENTN